MRWLVILMALAMPLVAWLSNSGTFGPDNGTVSDPYPTLLVAAGYAFAIWGLIFLLDLAYALWQGLPRQREHKTLRAVAPWTAAGFALTTLWMPLFSMAEAQPMLFWLCLLVIFAALGCLLRCALLLARDPAPSQWQRLLAWLPLSLHAGWMSLAAFLDLAQVIVAFELLPTGDMLMWSLPLLLLAAAMLLWVNARMRGNLAYVAAALWALVAVYVKQSGWDLPGSDVMAWAALAIAGVVAVQTLWLRMQVGRA